MRNAGNALAGQFDNTVERGAGELSRTVCDTLRNRKKLRTKTCVRHPMIHHTGVLAFTVILHHQAAVTERRRWRGKGGRIDQRITATGHGYGTVMVIVDGGPNVVCAVMRTVNSCVLGLQETVMESRDR